MAWTIAYFEEEDGSLPAEEFEDRLSTKLASKLDARVRAVSESGFSLGGGVFETCHDYSDLFEIRAQHGRELAREFAFVDGETLVLLDGVKKKVNEATPTADLIRAASRLARYKITRRTARG